MTGDPPVVEGLGATLIAAALSYFWHVATSFKLLVKR
jgi:hypothetical protein